MKSFKVSATVTSRLSVVVEADDEQGAREAAEDYGLCRWDPESENVSDYEVVCVKKSRRASLEAILKDWDATDLFDLCERVQGMLDNTLVIEARTHDGKVISGADLATVDLDEVRTLQVGVEYSDDGRTLMHAQREYPDENYAADCFSADIAEVDNDGLALWERMKEKA